GAGESAFRISELEWTAITIRRPRVHKTADLRWQWPPRRMTHRGQGSRRSPAVSMTQHDDLVTTGGELRGVHRGVIGFGSAVREERFLEFARCDLRQLLSQIGLGLVGVKRRGVRDRIDLIGDRL